MGDSEEKGGGGGGGRTKGGGVAEIRKETQRDLRGHVNSIARV